MVSSFSTWKRVALLLGALAFVLFLLLSPPLHQDQAYHSFADRRSILGVPNFLGCRFESPILDRRHHRVNYIP